VQITGALCIIYQGSERAGCLNFLAGRFIGAFLWEPVFVKMHRVVHGAACRASHAAEGQVFERRPKTAGWMALDMREIQQEGGILDHSASSQESMPL